MNVFLLVKEKYSYVWYFLNRVEERCVRHRERYVIDLWRTPRLVVMVLFVSEREVIVNMRIFDHEHVNGQVERSVH